MTSISDLTATSKAFDVCAVQCGFSVFLWSQGLMLHPLMCDVPAGLTAKSRGFDNALTLL